MGAGGFPSFYSRQARAELTVVVGSVAALLQLCCSSVAALLQYAEELLGVDSGSRGGGGGLPLVPFD